MVQSVPDDEKHLEQSEKHYKSQNKKTNVLIGLTIGLIVISIVGIVFSGYQVDALQEILNKLMGIVEEGQKQEFESLKSIEDTIKQSAEIKSLISLKIIPQGLSYSSFEVVNRFQSSFDGTTHEVIITEKPITLRKDDNVQFNLLVTNVGSDTVYLNSHSSANVIVGTGSTTLFSINVHPNGTVLSHHIGDFLEPNSNKIIPFWLEIDSNFTPNGRIIFTVFYENGKYETASINYVFES